MLGALLVFLVGALVLAVVLFVVKMLPDSELLTAEEIEDYRSVAKVPSVGAKFRRMFHAYEELQRHKESLMVSQCEFSKALLAAKIRIEELESLNCELCELLSRVAEKNQMSVLDLKALSDVNKGEAFDRTQRDEALKILQSSLEDIRNGLVYDHEDVKAELL